MLLDALASSRVRRCRLTDSGGIKDGDRRFPAFSHVISHLPLGAPQDSKNMSKCPKYMDIVAEMLLDQNIVGLCLR